MQTLILQVIYIGTATEPESNDTTESALTNYWGDDYSDYFSIATDFAYNIHYAEMVTSVNKYGGFYIGRYETTIYNNRIGSVKGKTILTSNQGVAQFDNNTCLWWGIYKLQRNSNVKGNGNIVQTNMVWGQQWDAMLEFFDRQNKIYTATTLTTLATTGKQIAGQAKYTYNNQTISDEICNIFDLRGNVYDWTGLYNGCCRVTQGGYYGGAADANAEYPGDSDAYYAHEYFGSRLTLYIK